MAYDEDDNEDESVMNNEELQDEPEPAPAEKADKAAPKIVNDKAPALEDADKYLGAVE